MATIYWAAPEEKQEIIDFIDLVFSKAHKPHDFATLLPKAYGVNGDATEHHVVVRENERIVAVQLCYPVRMRIGDKAHTILGIGSVSTHPNVRGKGYLRMMMEMADQRAKELGAAVAVLSGQRQRYQYYGFDHGGYQLLAKLEPVNVRHAMRDVPVDGLMLAPMEQAHVPFALELMQRDACYCERTQENFIAVLRTWMNQPFVILRDGKMIGYAALRPESKDYCWIAELKLDDEADFPAVMKMLSLQFGGQMEIGAAPWERVRARWLSSVCEEYNVAPLGMLKVYDQAQVDEAHRKLNGFLDVFAPLYISTLDAV